MGDGATYNFEAMIYRFGRYELDSERFELRLEGAPQRLEPQVFEVLAFLVENRSRLVPKDELLEKVWGDKYISDAALNSRLMAARRAIGDSGREQRWIRTQYGRGFRFVGPVEVADAAQALVADPVTEDDATAATTLLEPDAAAGNDVARFVHTGVGSKPRGRPRFMGVSAAAIALLVALVLTSFFLLRDDGDQAAVVAQGDCELPSQSVAASTQAGAITFTAEQEGRNALYRVNFDGSGLAVLFSDPLFDSDARWSPDGGRMLFTSRVSGNRDIFVMTSGQTPLRLTHDASDDLEPAWSPDGTLIAFASSRDGQRDIYLMTPDGTIRGRVTNDPADDIHPTWSPDGRWLAFASTRDGNRELYLVRTDGSCLRRLTDHIQDDDQPDWSPNGHEIAFQSRRDGNRELYTIGTDGKGLSRLTNDTADDRQPVWSPDGSFLAFVSSRDRVRRIYVVQSNGVGLRKLVETPGDQDQPAWIRVAP